MDALFAEVYNGKRRRELRELRYDSHLNGADTYRDVRTFALSAPAIDHLRMRNREWQIYGSKDSREPKSAIIIVKYR